MKRPLMNILMLIGVIGTLFISVEPSSAVEPARRWLAEPTLLAEGNRAATIDLAVVDEDHTWAIAAQNILFFDGTTWTTQFEAPEAFVAIEMQNASTGWAVTANATFAFDGQRWNLVNDSQQHFRELFLAGDGSLLARAWNGISGSNGRINMLVFHDNSWQMLKTTEGIDVTAQYVHVAADHSTWIWGNWSDLGSMGWINPLLYTYANGIATRIALPSIPSDIHPSHTLKGVYMLNKTAGWIGFYTEERAIKVYYYNAGTWTEHSPPALAEYADIESLHIMMLAGNATELLMSVGVQQSGSGCGAYTLLHYNAGVWTRVLEAKGKLSGSFLSGTMQGWISEVACSPAPNPYPKRYRYLDGTLTLDEAGSTLHIAKYILLNDAVQWGVSNGTIFRYAESNIPTERVDPQGPAHYFHETGHNVSGAFWEYYRSHGLDFGEPDISMAESLALFGLPLTEPFYELNPDLGEMVWVQYFERARMEYHPTNPPEYQVLLGRMGAVRYIQAFTYITNGNPDAPLDPDCERIEQTQHDLCPPFRDYWHNVGSPQIFGWPIAYTQQQQSITDGNTYLTLWTERQRMEHHEELAGTRYEMLLGLLGKEDLQVRGMLE